jgi:hypothetical protein
MDIWAGPSEGKLATAVIENMRVGCEVAKIGLGFESSYGEFDWCQTNSVYTNATAIPTMASARTVEPIDRKTLLYLHPTGEP